MKEEKQKIHAMMILEVIGKPKEFLVETLENLTKQIDAEPGVVIKSKNIKEPKKMEEGAGVADATGQKFKVAPQDFYTSFAEIEIETESFFNLILLIFKYMPANIEISSPEILALTNNGWNDILNELIRRLHAYDEIARVLQVEKAMLETKLKNILNEKPEEKKKTSVKKKK